VKELKEIIDKINIGDALSDSELDRALTFYASLENDLKLLGNHFHHAWFDVFQTFERLKSYKRARNERNA